MRMGLGRSVGLALRLAVWLMPATVAAAQAILVADAHVSSARPAVNAGSLTNLNVGGGYTALLRFDLSMLPAGTTSAQVSRAVLRVYCNRMDAAGTVSAALLGSKWDESAVTYASIPKVGTVLQSASVTSDGAFVTFDVTAAVQGWIADATSNFGVALQSSNAVVQFDSKENDETGHAAELQIVLATSGVAGPQGPAGAAGPQGLTGPQGVAGPQGLAGVAGAQGVAGLNGAQGAQGVAGPQGAAGAAGATGPQGPAGASGSVAVAYRGTYASTTNYALGDVVQFAGSSYVSLEDSNHGQTPGLTPQWALLAAQGATGVAGPVGPQGQAGAAGLQGPQGVAGRDGAPGVAGAAGKPGLTYQGTYSSVVNYASGDVVVFAGASYASLLDGNHGQTPGLSPLYWGALTAQGAQGLQGVPGAQGVAGPQGAPGSVGPPGERGDQGLQGIAGQAGAQGIPGAKGDPGLSGPMGPQGVAGPTGMTFQGVYSSVTNYAQGDGVSWHGAGYVSLVNHNAGQTPDLSPTYWALFATGTQGLTGATGPQGDTGLAGPQGLPGAAGAQGVAGPVGPRGQPVANYLGNYSSINSYAVADAVSYNGSTYISLIDNNHGQTPDQSPANWAVLAAQGLTGATGASGAQGPAGVPGAAGAVGPAGPQGAPVAFGGGWDVRRSYSTGDAVSYLGGSFIALTANVGRQPDMSPIYWGVLASAGAPGVVGPQGATGLQGPTGYPGPVGAPGAQGETGAVGPRGDAGTPGAVGPAGPAGVQGPIGPRGLSFQGTYASTTNYALGDAVSYRGSSYVSIADQNAGQSPDQSPNWVLIASAGTAGLPGAAGVTGATGPAGPQGVAGAQGASGAKGDPGAVGINFRSGWAAAANYAVNDAVTYNGSSYLALAASRNQVPDASPQSWAVLAQSGSAGDAVVGPAGPQGPVGPAGATGAAGAAGAQGPAGVNFLGAYQSTVNYALADAVSFGGSTYVSTVAGNQGQTPGVSPAYWSLLASKGDPGAAGAAGAVGPQGAAGPMGAQGPAGVAGAPVAFAGAWDVGRSYAVGDAVNYLGGSFIAVSSNTGRQPDVSPTYWGVLAAAGAQGPAGAQGLAGLQGPSGYPGAQGVAGPAGATGAAGPAGPAGVQGVPGAAGVAGPQGVAGAAGLSFRGAYDSTANYGVGDAVSFAGASYVSLVAANHGQTPGASPLNWNLLAAAGSDGVKGDTGAVGPAGLQGLQGVKGDTGEVGPRGLTGAVGATGPQGPAGAQGVAGAAGPVGPVGVSGADGATGPMGPQGAPVAFAGGWDAQRGYAVGDAVSYGGGSYIATAPGTGRQPDVSPTYWGVLAASGATGSVGPQGATGLQGPTGYPGPVGPQGEQGIAGGAGPRGDAGAQGVAGPAGAAGVQGPAGPRGVNVTGAYAAYASYALGDAVSYGGSSYVSLINQNVGQTPSASPAAWLLLASAGADGAAGATGPAGPIGLAGPAGPQGAQGLQGPTGYPGPQGATGAAGAAGPAGAIGSTGPQGVQGASGSAGPQGVAGPAGLSFQGTYDSTANYGVGDAVSFSGSSYVSLSAANHGQTPGLAPQNWALLALAGTNGAKGDTGAVGPAGAAGVAGPKGDSGPSGPQGAAGAAGAAGAVGAVGPQGAAGPAGSIGAAGAAGADGAAGPAGPQGPPVAFAGGWSTSRAYAVGDAVSYGGGSYIATAPGTGRQPDVSPTYWGVLSQPGAVGPTGPQGATGMQGPTGSQGSAGPAGPTGPQGVQGAQGGVGAKGDTGSTGVAGPAGAAGVVFRGAWSSQTNYASGDAVSYAGASYVSLSAGNVSQQPGSSAQAWSLLAAAGNDGAAGQTGAAGATGAQGAAGPAGGAGPTGAQGPAGTAGINFRGDWSQQANYAVNDAVTFAGSSYLAQSANQNQEPDTSPQQWAVLAQSGGAGPTGATGSAATVSVGTVSTLAAGSQATVTNSGTATAAVLNFAIPQGAAGSNGSGGGSSGSGGGTFAAMYHAVSFSTQYYSINAQAASASESGAVLAWTAKGCSAVRLDVFSQQSNAVTVTLRVGLPGSIADTALSCRAASGNSCTATGSVSVAAGSFMDLSITGASGSSAGVWTQLECD